MNITSTKVFNRQEFIDNNYTENKMNIKILFPCFINDLCDYPLSQGKHLNILFVQTFNTTCVYC